MRDYKRLLLSNKAWAEELKDENPKFFSRQAGGQSPAFLWIGCSDSRVSPEQMTMTQPGGMFIHRNIANLVYEDDLNLMSVLQYAVMALKVKHVIVCGHYGCGGIRAAMEGGVDGSVDRWLENARAVRHAHAEELLAVNEPDARLSRLVELNVRDQLVRLARTPTVQTAFHSGQPLHLHGWVYDIRDGHIKPLLDLDADSSIEDLGVPASVL